MGFCVFGPYHPWATGRHERGFELLGAPGGSALCRVQAEDKAHHPVAWIICHTHSAVGLQRDTTRPWLKPADPARKNMVPGHEITCAVGRFFRLRNYFYLGLYCGLAAFLVFFATAKTRTSERHGPKTET